MDLSIYSKSLKIIIKFVGFKHALGVHDNRLKVILFLSKDHSKTFKEVFLPNIFQANVFVGLEQHDAIVVGFWIY